MQWKRLAFVMLFIMTVSACSTAPDSSQAANPPTATSTIAPTDTPCANPHPH